MKKLDSKSKVLIATFSPWEKGKRLPINGNVEPMLDFFVPKVQKTVLIDQVYPGSDFVMPRVEMYENEKQKNITTVSKWMYILYPFLKIANGPGTHIIFKLRDYFSVLSVGFSAKEKFDYFIGFEAINALAGVFLKRFGKVEKVIYYVSDYSPNRYKQKWFNSLYLWLDRKAAEKADVIWDVSKAMQPARINAGLNPTLSAPVLNVPNALYPNQIKVNPYAKIQQHSLVFMGTLGEENGPGLAIESLPPILKKFPKTTLHIVGGGKDLERLKKITEEYQVQKQVIFYGFIADRERVSATIRQFQIALAPYRTIPGSARYFGDATKIRAYLAAGLPTITTFVPPLGKDAAEKNAAIQVHDNPKAISDAVIKLFSDKKLYQKLREGAIDFAKENTWENEFLKAFKQMEQFPS